MNSGIKAILVDDEQDSLITISEQFGLYCPEVEIIGSYPDPEVALDRIIELRPDVAFLDIKMPKLNGLELAKRITPLGVKVVFITAYEKYALAAIKLSALDFLLKPLQDPDELRAVIAKLRSINDQRRQLPLFGQLLANEEKESYSQETEIGLADEKGVYFYQIKEIIRLKADKNCCEFYFTGDRKQYVTKNLGSFVEPLKKYNLVQVNRSEVINLTHRKELIKKGGPTLVMSDGSKVIVSNNYKQNLPYYNRPRKRPFLFFLHRSH